MKRIPFNILFRAVLSDVLSVLRFFYYSHSSSGVFLEHFGSKKSNHGVFVQDLGIAMVVESYEQDRLFQDAVHDRVQALPGIYCGSRDAAVRYIYRGTTLGNFIELKPEQPPMTPAEFFGLLSAVPGVLEVVLHPQSKLEQGKRGHYYQERAFLVYSRAHPQHGFEFELTTHNHVKNCSTISALYKSQGNRSRAMEAWRILKHSVAGRELNAGVVEIIDTELRKLAGASDFTDTGRPRDSVSSYSNITVASSAVEQWLLRQDAALLEFRQLFGPEGGPPCKVCHQLPSVCHCDARGLVCHRCLQKDENKCWAYHLNWKHRANPLLGDPIIMFNVAVFILGTGLNRYCQCDGCDPNWFLRGWVCYDVRLTRHDSW